MGAVRRRKRITARKRAPYRPHLADGVSWLALVAEIDAWAEENGRSHGAVAAIARRHGVPQQTLNDHWQSAQEARRTIAAAAAGDGGGGGGAAGVIALAAAGGDDREHRGRHKRALSDEEEADVIARVRGHIDNGVVLHDGDIRTFALDRWRQRPAEVRALGKPFTASSGWVRDFRARWHSVICRPRAAQPAAALAPGE